MRTPWWGWAILVLLSAAIGLRLVELVAWWERWKEVVATQW